MSNFMKVSSESAPRVELHEKLGLTGAEISINTIRAGESVPFIHSHKQNEEIYYVISGSGKAAHIESGIAYGLGKKCYAIGEYDATDTLYNIFETIFNSETELEEFLKKYYKR